MQHHLDDDCPSLKVKLRQTESDCRGLGEWAKTLQALIEDDFTSHRSHLFLSINTCSAIAILYVCLTLLPMHDRLIKLSCIIDRAKALGYRKCNKEGWV